MLFESIKYSKLLKGSFIPNSMKEINLTENNTELDWAESDLQNCKALKKSTHQPCYLIPICWKKSWKAKTMVKMNDHKRYKSQMWRFTNIETLLHLISFMLQLTGRCILRLFLMIRNGLARNIHGTQITAITTSSLWNPSWKQKYNVQ